MGEYKTQFRLCLLFFWTGLQNYFLDWFKGCSYCVAHNVCRSRKSELYFSWIFIMPFYIMHVDIWSPVHLVDYNQDII